MIISSELIVKEQEKVLEDSGEMVLEPTISGLKHKKNWLRVDRSPNEGMWCLFPWNKLVLHSTFISYHVYTLVAYHTNTKVLLIYAPSNNRNTTFQDFFFFSYRQKPNPNTETYRRTWGYLIFTFRWLWSVSRCSIFLHSIQQDHKKP